MCVDLAHRGRPGSPDPDTRPQSHINLYAKRCARHQPAPSGEPHACLLGPITPQWSRATRARQKWDSSIALAGGWRLSPIIIKRGTPSWQGQYLIYSYHLRVAFEAPRPCPTSGRSYTPPLPDVSRAPTSGRRLTPTAQCKLSHVTPRFSLATIFASDAPRTESRLSVRKTVNDLIGCFSTSFDPGFRPAANQPTRNKDNEGYQKQDKHTDTRPPPQTQTNTEPENFASFFAYTFFYFYNIPTIHLVCSQFSSMSYAATQWTTSSQWFSRVFDATVYNWLRYYIVSSFRTQSVVKGHFTDFTFFTR